MITILLDDLAKQSKNRPSGYTEDVLSRASSITATYYTLTDDVYLELVKKYKKQTATKYQLAYTTEEEYQKRKRACMACEFNVNNECSLCGCCGRNLENKWKTKNSYCDKWDQLPPETIISSGVP